jgi:hypothetical protein
VTPAGDVFSGSRYRWIGGEDNIWFRVVWTKCAETQQGGPGASTLPASDYEAVVVVDTSFRHPIPNIWLVGVRFLGMANDQDSQSGHRLNPKCRAVDGMILNLLPASINPASHCVMPRRTAWSTERNRDPQLCRGSRRTAGH